MRILQAGLRWCQHSPGVKATIKQRDSSVTAVGLCVLWAASKPGSVGISFRSGQECVCVYIPGCPGPGTPRGQLRVGSGSALLSWQHMGCFTQ